jgi:hypothetical protein
VNNELDRMWKEAVVASFNALPHHLFGGTEENYQKPQSGYLVSEPTFEPGTTTVFGTCFFRIRVGIIPYLRKYVPSNLLPSGFPAESCMYVPIIPYTCATYSIILTLFDLIIPVTSS